MSSDYVVKTQSTHFVDVVYSRSISALDYEHWLSKGFVPLFPPTKRICNMDSYYDVTFKSVHNEYASTVKKNTDPMGFDYTPIPGQDALVNGKELGRVVGYEDSFPHQSVSVMLYATGVTRNFAGHNVQIVGTDGVLRKVQSIRGN